MKDIDKLTREKYPANVEGTEAFNTANASILMKKTYRPLPSFLTIKDSEVEGLGLFATEEIYEDICLGATHVFDIRFENHLIRTPLGGFINHSNSPNCIIRQEEGTGSQEEGFPVRKYLHSLRNIKPGEELTVTYTTYKIN